MPTEAEAPPDLLTPLTATAIVLGGLLARGWAPGLAWVAFVAGSLLATAVPVGLARDVDRRPHNFEVWVGTGRRMAGLSHQAGSTSIFPLRDLALISQSSPRSQPKGSTRVPPSNAPPANSASRATKPTGV